MTGVFTVFNHLTDIGIVYDIVVILLTRHLLGLEFFDTLPKSLDFFNEFFVGRRHFNENSWREWVASGRAHVFLEKYKF
jgi:hypothetical protein